MTAALDTQRQWERRKGTRAPDGWHWHKWEPCTEAQARRVSGLRSWQVQLLTTTNRRAAMRPEFITFTGVDDDTDPAGLVQLADDYPVEFGLLFSPKRQGVEPRYPKLTTIEWLLEELPLRWAAHLCGADARTVLEAGYSQHDRLLARFQRAQINTTNPAALLNPERITQWAVRRNVRAIVQCRGAFPLLAPADVLFDASGGRGIAPAEWPRAVNTTFCGYAGGLRPENVAEAVRVIGTRATRYWIDMESGVRDERDRFSLEKCRAVCEAVYGGPFVGGTDGR